MNTLMRVLSLIWESYWCLCNITKVISRNVCFNTHFLESEVSGGGGEEKDGLLISGGFINRVSDQNTSYRNGHCIQIKVKLIDYYERHCCFYLRHYNHLVDRVFLNSVPGTYLAYLILGTRLHLRVCVLHNIVVSF